jgi:hypothetical protein
MAVRLRLFIFSALNGIELLLSKFICFAARCFDHVALGSEVFRSFSDREKMLPLSGKEQKFCGRPARSWSLCQVYPNKKNAIFKFTYHVTTF